MSKELKAKTFWYLFALGMSFWLWWNAGALPEDHFMIWMGAVFLIGAIEVFGYCWDLAVFAINKLSGR